MTKTLLRIDASARVTQSVSRDLADEIAARLAPKATIVRDLTDALSQIDADWIRASGTPEPQRSDASRAALALSDRLIGELHDADTVLISLPIYNFGVPTALKAWIDLVARAGVTFRYTDTGPKGLLTGKRAILVVASGGTQVDSAIDFATPYLRHVLGFIGIDDVAVVSADRLGADAPAALAKARSQIDGIAA